MSEIKANDGNKKNRQDNDIEDSYWPKQLEEPIVRVRFRWEEPEGYDSYKLRCPYCDGEIHYHPVNSHPRVALGGLSSARCKASGERYYLLLAENGRGPSAEFIHSARRRLANLPGDKLNGGLVPKGIDPRVIDDMIPGWSDN